MPKLRTFLELDTGDRFAAFEAMAQLLRAKALVVLVPPRKWRARFGMVADAPREETLEPADRATVRRVRYAINRALRNVPGSANCLPQALAARWMLERRGVASSLYLGTAPASKTSPRFHAWLKVGSEWVTGDCDERAYSLLTPSDAERP